MKKIAMILALASICLMSAIVPTRAGDGIIIHMRTTPTPTPTPAEGGRSAVINDGRTSNEIPSFWDFLGYFGL